MQIIHVTPGPLALSRAIAALPMNDEPVTLRLAPGRYEEKVELRRPHTVIEGAGASETVITWHDAAFTILPDGVKRGTFRSYTLLVLAEDVTLRGLTIENTASPRETSGQCIALFADGDGFVCEDCVLRSHQDTLFTAPLPPKEVEPGGFNGPTRDLPRTPQRQIYRHCRIEGDVDFIFGGAAAWFFDCDIVYTDGRTDRSVSAGGWCTAASTPQGQRFGYVFDRCRFMAEGDPGRTVYLGRPWRAYAKTVLLRCELGAHIRAEGWHDWGKADFHANGFYAEYACTGPGAAGDRAAFAHTLTDEEAEAYTLERFMAADPREEA